MAVRGLPILKPPYSRITAIDLSKGETAWVVPLGETPLQILNHPALTGITLPATGGLTKRATLLVTKTLLFAGEGWSGDRTLRAYDKATGTVVAELSLPGRMGSMPMTYMVNGKQYIAFTVGDQDQPAELIALTPED